MNVWNLLGHRVGDNAQVLALSSALNWRSETKTLVWKKPLPAWTPLYGRRVGLNHLMQESRNDLTAPGPDVVISVGWRSVPVARWIKDNSGAKLIHIGRPRAPLKYFDLVLTTPQYRLPKSQNVLMLSGPIVSRPTEQPAKDLDSWSEALFPPKRPWIAVLIGGNAPPIHLTRASVCDFAIKCNELAESLSGSLLITSGPRTPDWALDLFMMNVTVPHFRRGWDETGQNPYAAFLALADAFIVTNDSISMTQEAASTQKPLFFYNFPKQNSWLQLAQKALDPLTNENNRWLSPAINRLVEAGLVVLPRFPEDYHAGLISSNRAVPLGTRTTLEQSPVRRDETEKVVQAVHALFRQRGAEHPQL